MGSKRTAESYLREAAVKPIEKHFDYTDERTWPSDRLFDSLIHDQVRLDATLGADAKREVGRIIAHKTFELAQRSEVSVEHVTELLAQNSEVAVA